MKIRLSSLLVSDQSAALAFYTEKLGFVTKNDISMGEYRWLTVVSPEDPNGAELLLEPMAFDPAKTYQKALFDAGIPATAFQVDDIDQEYTRLSGLGVELGGPPALTGGVKTMNFNDTCGNRIQLYQVLNPS